MSHDVRTFGKYLLDREIARGGMARVHLARLRGLGGFEKRLVVKQILPELASDPRFVSMFVDEAKTVVQMSHPHIVPVYELGVVDGVYFLAMEYVEGATLSEILRAGPMTAQHVAHVGVEISDALHYAHSRFSVVHRDVTPRNVIVDGNGHSRLLDFGIAAPVEGEDAATFGTPGYLSPEQIAVDSPGPRSDVFSLGAVLFEALTGTRAFDAKDIEAARVALETPPDFDAIEDPELAAIVRRALEPVVEDRWESARALGRALRGWLAPRAPEGVGPELGQRVQRVNTERERLASGDFAIVEPDEASASLTPQRTLATSPLLAGLLGDDPAPPPIDLALDPTTAAIEGRRSTPSPDAERVDDPTEEDDEPPATAAIEGRRSSAPDRVDSEPRAAPPALSPPSPRGASRYALIGALALSAVGAWVLWPGASAVEPPEAEPPVAVATEPPEIRTAPPEPPTPREIPAPPEVTPEPPVEPPPAPVARTTPLTVNAVPWGEVLVDGRLVGNTPQRRIALRPGSHTVEVRCPPLGRTARTRVEASGAPITVLADLNQDPPTIRAR